MNTRLNDKFRDLHSTLARLRLLTLMADENIMSMLPAADQQDLAEWLHHLATLAANQALEVESAASEIPQEGDE